MKNLFKLPVLALGLVLLLSGITQKVQAQDDDISLQTFYDELSPYGTWIQDEEYGYVWRPDVDQSEFRPYYSSGRWVMTEYGNTWVSDYDWGWAPFHYGRWIQNRYNDWLWIPDTVWGPAWVSWRSGGGYYGWAPLTPGFNINIGFGGGYDLPNSYWCFVPQAQIYYNNFPRYRSYRNVTIIRNTTIINNTGQRNRNNYYTGPRRDDIRRATNQDVRVYNVSRSNRSGRSTFSNNTVNIYNPRNNRGVDSKNAAPRSVVNAGEYNASRGGRGTVPNNQSVTGARNNRQQSEQAQRGEANPHLDRTNTRNREPQTAAQQQAQAQRAERNRQQQSTGQQPAQADRANRGNQEQTQAQVQRAERNRQQETQAAEQRGRQQQAQAQQQQQAQNAERSRQQETQAAEQRSRQQQAQAQQQQQAQNAERSRQQETQAAEQRSRQQQAQAQQQQQQQQQQQRQERSRQETQQRAPQVQQQRQERVQQSAPRSESRGGGESQGASRSSRSSRG